MGEGFQSFWTWHYSGYERNLFEPARIESDSEINNVERIFSEYQYVMIKKSPPPNNDFRNKSPRRWQNSGTIIDRFAEQLLNSTPTKMRATEASCWPGGFQTARDTRRRQVIPFNGRQRFKFSGASLTRANLCAIFYRTSTWRWSV